MITALFITIVLLLTTYVKDIKNKRKKKLVRRDTIGRYSKVTPKSIPAEPVRFIQVASNKLIRI